ncbi:epithelial membrane protein 1 isoform X1 [Symphalangus syndactylus]|uniref:epithelial membrane protein 1 isoform X1 n=1 Tax=Symphalangus syndactylus TaxID=9590 RepID=UPI003003BD76
MLVLLAGIFVVHIATVIMLFVSTIANVWMVSNMGNASVGLWKNCTDNSCTDSLSYAGEDALKTVQAFMILSIIFSVISLLVFVFQLFTMEKGNRFFLSGATKLVCCEYLMGRLQFTLLSPSYYRCFWQLEQISTWFSETSLCNFLLWLFVLSWRTLNCCLG